MTQCERIVKYMEDFGSISTMEAFTQLGITRLASRIHELTKNGLVIKKEQVGGGLQAHHIKRWSTNVNERYQLSNGVTLCEKCHKELHRKGG